MSKYGATGRLKSFQNAFNGLSLAFKSQKNYRFHLLLAFLSLLLGVMLNFRCLEYCILLLAISNVITAELFNSVIEFTLDAYYKNKFSQLVKMAKDLAAGVVFLAATTSILIGLLLFTRKILTIILYQ